MNKLKVGILLSYICIASISSAIITPALTNIEVFFSLSHGALEWVVSIFLLGYVIGQLIYGPIANRYGRLTALRVGLIINLIGIVMCICSTHFMSYGLLLFGRLITALGAAAGLSCTFMLLNELLTEKEAKSAMSFAIVSFTLGIGLAVTLGGIITTYFNWQYSFWILMFHGIIMYLLTYLFTETLQKPINFSISKVLSGYKLALTNKTLIIFSLTLGFVSAISYCYSVAAPVYAISVLKLTASEYGYWNIINMFGMFASGFISARLMKKYGAKKLLKIGFITLAPCLLSLVLIVLSTSSHIVWFFMTTMFLYLCGGLLFPACSYLASNAIEDKASGSSMMSFINMMTAMLSVIIMGYLPFAMIVSFSLVLGCLFLLTLVLTLYKS
tara:strand:+ start:9220 stop:10377 length:1158 start_codon:yes stop_codon:yes gene_type:complete